MLRGDVDLRSIRIVWVTWLILIMFVGSAVGSPSHARAESNSKPTIAIIIDDMGTLYEHGLELINLPFPLTFSFLPGRPHTTELAELAHQQHQEIMLHAPMENVNGLDLGPGGLTEDMSEQQLKSSLLTSLRTIPHVSGVNNHMGSKLTANPLIMTWVMAQLRAYPIFFVDSRTTHLTVAAKTAEDFQIPNLSRDVFLDHVQTGHYLEQQFARLLALAQQNGTAVAIAHPHRMTIDFLKEVLPQLDEQGIGMATISALWQLRHPKEIMYADKLRAASQYLYSP